MLHLNTVVDDSKLPSAIVKNIQNKNKEKIKLIGMQVYIYQEKISNM